MSKTPHNKLDYIQSVIDIKKVDASPYQLRKHFNEDKLKELAASILREGLIEPIVVRPKKDRYELIAGERRLRAVRHFTEMETIKAQIVIASDLQARRISAAENIQREDLSAIETIEAFVEIVDADLIEDTEYLSMGKTPGDRVKTLLGKLHSITSSQIRGSKVSEKAELLFNKFVKQVEHIFKNLPKPLEWQSFYIHDLPILIDFCEEVQKVSIQHHLNKSQTRALEKLKAASEEEFRKITTYSQSSQKSQPERCDQGFRKINVRDLSAREIEEITEKAAKKQSLRELNMARVSPSLNLETKILILSRLGIPVNRIAARLKVNRLTALKYSGYPRLVRSIRSSLKNGNISNQVAKEHDCTEPLVWSIVLDGKSDRERFEALNWGLRTWDHWYFNNLDPRFGDNWPAHHREHSGEAGGPGQIPAQLVAHTLFYFTKQGDLVFDPMAGGGVVADTCLAFHRKCWSFDLVDRPETRPEIEPHQWNPKGLLWPVMAKEKPALIFFDPPASPEGEADGGQVRLILTNLQTNTQRTVSLVFPARNIWDSSESFSL